MLMILTQRDVLGLEGARKPYYSAQLGNLLRESTGKLADEHVRLMNKIIVPFRKEMIKLIKATDGEIVERQVEISPTEMVFPDDKKLWSDTKLSIAELLEDHTPEAISTRVPG